jgi:uncharacterized protein
MLPRSSRCVLLVSLLFLWPCLAGAQQPDPIKDAVDQLLGRLLPSEPRTPEEALWQAAAKGDVGRIKALLDDGVGVDAVDERGNSALMIAAWKGQTAAVSLLLDRGANIDLQDNYGKTALFIAAWFNRAPVVKELLARRANTELRATTPSPGGTPLVRAVDKANEEIVQLLLAAGADLTAADNEGVTPLANARDSRRAVYKRITALMEAEAARRVTASQGEAKALLDEASTLPGVSSIDSIKTGEELAAAKAELAAAKARLARWQQILDRVAEIEQLLPKLDSELPADEAERWKQSAKLMEESKGRLVRAESVVAALELKAKLDANWAEATKIQGELGKPARGTAEQGRRRELLATYERLLGERRQLVGQLDEKSAAAERSRLAAMSTKLQQLTSGVARERVVAESAQLDATYRQLESQFKAQQDKWSRAFKTPAQAAEARRLLDLLRQMEANRRAASAARPEAAAELRRVRAEIDKLLAREPGLR